MRSPIAALVISLVVVSCTTTRVPSDVGAGAGQQYVGAGSSSLLLGARTQEPTRGDFERALKKAYQAGRSATGGKNADYIPELAKVDANQFGIVAMKINGETFEVGDSQAPFTIQSISKVFTLARAMKDSGADVIEQKVGVNATGQAFNSIVALGLNTMQKRPGPGNPLVNPGAIATVSFIKANNPTERWNAIAETMSSFAGRPLTVDETVYKSETDTNARNKGFSWILKADEVIEGDPPEMLDLYTRQCSIAVTARDLAAMGATLANGGTNPRTGERIVDPKIAARVLAVMATAGLYETTGAWMFHVGAPAKSGVGGGIVAVVPGRYAVAAFAPPLDEAGNSVKAQKAIEAFITELGGNVFMAPEPTPRTASVDEDQP